jgi:hypothetical protein
MDLVGTDPERLSAFQEDLRDALTVVKRTVLAGIRQEMLFAHPEDAGMEP